MRERRVGGKESRRIYLEGDVREKGMGSKEKLTTYYLYMFGGRREWEGRRVVGCLEREGSKRKGYLENMVRGRREWK